MTRLHLHRSVALRARGLAADETGSVLVFTIGVFLFLFVLILSVYSLGEAIRQKEELQNACDAAAHAGAVAQADDLSRIAVLNRALSWNYVQMTKLQMDYITYNWLRVTCDKFAEDKQKCLAHTNPLDLIPDRSRGYAFIPDILDDTVFSGLKTGTLGIPTEEEHISIYGVDIGWATKWLVFNCYHNIHNNGDNRISNYIGMRDGNSAPEEGRAEEIRINGHDLDDLSLRFRAGARSGAPYGGDLDLVSDGKVVQSAILKELESRYGGYGCPDLQNQIETCKGQAAVYAALIGDVNREMKEDIASAVRETLRQNLPRMGDADPEDDVLGDYFWFCAGGTSIGPREYETADEAADGEGGGEGADDGADDGGEDGGEGGKAYASFFSGLRNTEQDEMVFLNMADGLPANARVTLADYFADKDSDAIDGGGLDQWFIRCLPDESKMNGAGEGAANSTCGGESGVCVERNWVAPTPGIIRCYKNANYHDARSNGLIPPYGVHRGNYLFDGVQKFFESLAGAVGDAIAQVLSRVSFIMRIPFLGDYIKDAISDSASKIVSEALSAVTGGMNSDIVVPSCYNARNAFPDTCAAVPDSWGLVAEYKWAAAYWLCIYEATGVAPLLGYAHIDLAFPGVSHTWEYFNWHDDKTGTYTVDHRTDDIDLCVHIPFPLGAMCGGASETGYQPGGLFDFLEDVKKNFPRNIIGSPSSNESVGHSRDGYRAGCIFIDGEPFKKGCEHNEVLPNGLGSNTLLKSYVRVYGDDRDAYDENYCGTFSMPWLLNENFFNGGGTILVGLARKRRNVFEAIVGGNIPEDSLHAPFSPPDGSHVVALAAARAAYAPRQGNKTAAGDDTENAAGGRRYDLHYDAVCKDLKPKIMRGGHPKAEWEALAAELESAPYWIGCVCTGSDGNKADSDKMAQTANRLRRQWNLCQTDWDGVLLPLRFSRAAIREFNSNPAGDNPATASGDASPEWGPFASDLGEDDAVFELAQILTMIEESEGNGSMLWHSFDETKKTTLPKLLDGKSPSEPANFTEAVRKRRVL